MEILDNNLLSFVNESDVTRDGTLVIPKGVEIIGENFISSRARKLVKKIIIPNSVKKICDGAFSQLKLDEITIPNSVEELGQSIFANSIIEGEIILPNRIKTIPEGMFNDASIRGIEIPESVEVIEPFAFNTCYVHDTIVLPKKLREIKKYSFSGCTLDYIQVPESVELIDDGAFLNCIYLKEVDLNEGLYKIKDETFRGCYDLKKINIPSTVTSIGESCFRECYSLKEINLPNGISRIGTNAFCDSGLVKATLPSGLTTLEDGVFGKCYKLESVIFPNNLEKIGANAFFECEKLKNVNLPDSLYLMGERSFYGCKSIEFITIPKNVLNIDNGCFEECTKLKDIQLQNGLMLIGEDAFFGCTNLKGLELPSSLQSIKTGGIPFKNRNFYIKMSKSTSLIGSLKTKRAYVKKINENQFIIKRDKDDDAVLINGSILHHLGIYVSLNEHAEQIKKDMENPQLKILYNTLFNELINDEFRKFYNNSVYKFYTKIIKEVLSRLAPETNKEKTIECLCKILYNLNGFEKQKEVIIEKKDVKTTKVVYNAQKVGEYFIEIIKEGILDPNELIFLFKDMPYFGEKKDFSRLFLNKTSLKQLIQKAYEKPGFIAKVYKDIEAIRDRNKKNQSEQRNLSLTVEMIDKYADDIIYDNQKPGTEHIAKKVSRFFTKQRTFDNAVSILEEKERMKIPDSILGKHLVEESIIGKIQKHSSNIQKNATETLQILTSVASDKFTYDWLLKNDPDNLILGKLCDCCAHLEGMGYGIMRASIIHPNIQNLVIRDSSGDIIAKATLFVNREKGYGVFNTISARTANLNEKKKNLIYKKFIEGVNEFAKEYNIENTDNPLKILTVGLSFNKLSDEITSNHKKSDTLYKAVHYGDYAQNQGSYEGDSSACQYIVWEDKDNGR